MSADTRATRRPVVLSVAVGAALLLLALGLGIVLFSDYRYRDEQRQEADTQAKVVAASIVAPLDFQDRQSAQEYLVALRANSRVARAVVRDRQGKVFVAYDRGEIRRATDATRVTVPVLRGSETIGSVTLTETIDPLWRRLARYSFILLLIAVAGLLIGVFALGQAALHRANAALSQRADALGEAYEALEREIEERASAEEQLRQSQKMQALGQLTGGIAHDFNNLLTVMRGTADLLRRPDLPEARRIRYAESIAQTADRAAQLTSQLLAFSRRQPLQPKVIDLNAQIDGMRLMIERVFGAHYTVRTEFHEGLCAVEIDPTQLEVAILNIVVNARDAMAEGGILTIATSPWPPDVDEDGAERDAPRFAAVSVTDTGAGMDAETVARATEPFFTTKTVGKGTGLGLSQVYGFAAQSGGEVTIASAPGRGTTVRLTLPCTGKPYAPTAAVPDAFAPGKWCGRILFVEDNEEVAAFARTLLEELGHQVLHAASAEAALESVEQGAPFDFVLSDIVMPGMSGFDLAQEVRRLRPGTPVLLTTGYSERLNEEGAGGFPILAKPYSLDELAHAIERTCASRGPTG